MRVTFCGDETHKVASMIEDAISTVQSCSSLLLCLMNSWLDMQFLRSHLDCSLLAGGLGNHYTPGARARIAHAFAGQTCNRMPEGTQTNVKQPFASLKV